MKKIKEAIKKILNSYKAILCLSFLINIILLIFTYKTVTSNNIYIFNGSDDYIKVTDGAIALNTDINMLIGNNIEYINDTDYEINEYKIAYYVLDGNKKEEIISTSNKLDETIKLSEIINNFTSFDIIEKHNNSTYFTKKNKELLKDGLYLMLNAKTKDGEEIKSDIKLEMLKVTKN